MARIRTIKPEFWSNEKVMACSRDARLLFLGMLNFADDAGRMVNAPKTLKAQIFPGDDDVASENVRRWLLELSRTDLVRPYEADGRAYLQITGWDHQRIDKPRPSKIPAPKFDEASPNDRGVVLPVSVLSTPKVSVLGGDTGNIGDNSPEQQAREPAGDLATALPAGALARLPTEEPGERKRPADNKLAASPALLAVLERKKAS